MPLLEIDRITKYERTTPGANHLGERQTKTVIDIPDQLGTYYSGLGQISVKELKKDDLGRLREITIEGEILRGTPLKNRHKRNSAKRISLGLGGYGQQTLSKTEKITAIAWNSYSDTRLNGEVPQIDLNLGVPVVIEE